MGHYVPKATPIPRPTMCGFLQILITDLISAQPGPLSLMVCRTKTRASFPSLLSGHETRSISIGPTHTAPSSGPCGLSCKHWSCLRQAVVTPDLSLFPEEDSRPTPLSNRVCGGHRLGGPSKLPCAPLFSVDAGGTWGKGPQG